MIGTALSSSATDTFWNYIFRTNESIKRNSLVAWVHAQLAACYWWGWMRMMTVQMTHIQTTTIDPFQRNLSSQTICRIEPWNDLKAHFVLLLAPGNRIASYGSAYTRQSICLFKKRPDGSNKQAAVILERWKGHTASQTDDLRGERETKYLSSSGASFTLYFYRNYCIFHINGKY